MLEHPGQERPELCRCTVRISEGGSEVYLSGISAHASCLPGQYDERERERGDILVLGHDHFDF